MLTIVSAIRIASEPRRLSNALIVLAALLAWVLTAVSVMNLLEPRVEAAVLAVIAVLLFLTAIGLIAAAAVNGVVVIRREGFRLATVLPLALATVTILGAGLLFTVARVLESHPLPLWFLALLWTGVFFAVGLGLQLAAFSVYAVIYGHLRPPTGNAAVLVLGCGLGAGGTVTPLLASRLDRAREVYDAEVEAGHRPVLVVSGGQGVDEAMAEATAMKNYLKDYGMSEENIIAETSSRTTHENLVFSAELLDSMGIEYQPMIVVTSNFHVLRAAAFTRDVGLDAQVTGARTARFYAPTAFLREFVAIVRGYWKANVALLLGILAAVVLLQNVD
ncbi:YdcF family protein [Dietzia lutea]|uniref:YdcF family protein n=1 Tax=Dietzia lutea TaxID=546160 RepID=UPI0013A535A1|nr:YdcF family protein [Dietzia lutea]